MEQLTELRKLELEYCPLPLYVTEFHNVDDKDYKVYRCYFNPVLDRSERFIILESIFCEDSYLVEFDDPQGYHYWSILNAHKGGLYEHHVPSID